MSGFLVATAIFLLLTLLLGMLRVVRGPGRADRMLAAQLFGTTGVAILLLIGRASGERAPMDVALVFALLAAVVGVAFVSGRQGRGGGGEGEGEEGGGR
jgi:multicomponent Na+:H+ antiporter subunit F